MLSKQTPSSYNPLRTDFSLALTIDTLTAFHVPV